MSCQLSAVMVPLHLFFSKDCIFYAYQIVMKMAKNYLELGVLLQLLSGRQKLGNTILVILKLWKLDSI
jgi:hypothetical protein